MTPSVQAVLRQWIREQINDQDEISVPALADQAVTHFSNNKAFLQQLALETLPKMLADMVYDVLSRDRGRAIRLGDTLVTQTGFDRRVSKFRAWYEHAGRDRTISLLALTRETGKIAADERRRRGDEEHRRARFIEELTQELKDGETVGDRYSDQEIQKLLDEIWPGGTL
jgi:hypothetical protein